MTRSLADAGWFMSEQQNWKDFITISQRKALCWWGGSYTTCDCKHLAIIVRRLRMLLLHNYCMRWLPQIRSAVTKSRT